jgi:hypothetical protein
LRKNLLAVVFLAICTLLVAQQPLPAPASSSEQQIPPAMAPDGSAAQPAPTQLSMPDILPTAQKALNNDGVIKMVKAGLSDDLIVSTINAQPGSYDTSADALNALKAAGASGKVLVAIVMKTAGPAQVAPAAPAAPTPIPPMAAPAATHATTPAPCSPAPTMQLSLCEFQVDGTSKSGNTGAFVGGLAGAAIASSGTHTYYRDINEAVKHVYQTAIEKSCRFQVVNSETHADSEGGKHLSLAEIARKNNLTACVSAKPYWAAKMGFDKEVAIYTRWEIESPGGCKAKFKTSVSSDNTYGKFPNGADPTLQPVYLGLSKQDAGQFLEEFHRAIEKSGCWGPTRNP